MESTALVHSSMPESTAPRQEHCSRFPVDGCASQRSEMSLSRMLGRIRPRAELREHDGQHSADDGRDDPRLQ
jgi:hypothetical protein